MRRAIVAGLIVAAPLTVAACVQILSYDDYRARPAEAPDTNFSATDTLAADTFDALDADPGPAHAPARPDGSPTPSGKGKTIWTAVKRMYVGSMTSLGEKSPNAWREFGFDLDNVCTSLDDSIKNVGTCRRHVEASQDFLLDGDRCRDNNFGRHVVQLLTVSSEGFEQRINNGIFEGDATWIIRIDDLDDGVDDAFAPAKLYRASSTKGAPPKWDGTDVRKVLRDSLVDGTLDKPIADFPNGYVRNNVWVSGEPALRELVLPVSDSLYVKIELESTLFTVALDADHTSGTRGVLGGAVPMKSIEALLEPIATSSGFCKGSSLYNSLLRSVQRFPDVVIGAPNLQDTTADCDGLSLGLAFDLASVQPVSEIVDPLPPAPNPCVDAGPDTADVAEDTASDAASDSASDAEIDGT